MFNKNVIRSFIFVAPREGRVSRNIDGLVYEAKEQGCAPRGACGWKLVFVDILAITIAIFCHDLVNDFFFQVQSF